MNKTMKLTPKQKVGVLVRTYRYYEGTMSSQYDRMTALGKLLDILKEFSDEADF